jgi:hypothetical protein
MRLTGLAKKDLETTQTQSNLLDLTHIHISALILMTLADDVLMAINPIDDVTNAF